MRQKLKHACDPDYDMKYNNASTYQTSQHRQCGEEGGGGGF